MSGHRQHALAEEDLQEVAAKRNGLSCSCRAGHHLKSLKLLTSPCPYIRNTSLVQLKSRSSKRYSVDIPRKIHSNETIDRDEDLKTQVGGF